MSIFVHREPFNYLIKKCPVSFGLIVLVTLVYLLDPILNYAIFQVGALVPVEVHHGAYYQLLLSMFLHGSFLHFFSNTIFGLAIIGMALEKMIGSLKYALVYFTSGIGASLLIYLIYYYLPWLNPFIITIGASGAIFGSLGVLLFLVFHRPERLYEADRQYLIGLFVINLVITFVVRNISVVGHLGGLMIGYLIGLFLFWDGSAEHKEHKRMQKEWKAVRKTYGE